MSTHAVNSQGMQLQLPKLSAALGSSRSSRQYPSWFGCAAGMMVRPPGGVNPNWTWRAKLAVFLTRARPFRGRSGFTTPSPKSKARCKFACLPRQDASKRRRLGLKAAPHASKTHRPASILTSGDLRRHKASGHQVPVPVLGIGPSNRASSATNRVRRPGQLVPRRSHLKCRPADGSLDRPSNH
jgi:hypothetical protein